MHQCWESDPKKRPTFDHIRETLRLMLESLVDDNYHSYMQLNSDRDYYNVVQHSNAELDDHVFPVIAASGTCSTNGSRDSRYRDPKTLMKSNVRKNTADMDSQTNESVFRNSSDETTSTNISDENAATLKPSS